MNHQNHEEHASNQEQTNQLPQAGYSIKDFIPLIVIFTIIIIATVVKGLMAPPITIHSMMYDFMGFFFLIFGTFKIINLQNFAEAYSTYDLIAQRSRWYALSYPFIEIALGAAYITHWAGTGVHICTLIIMLISAAGVANELRKGNQIVCACLGVVFKIPMTYVTLLEDLLMAVMAVVMLSGV